MSAAAGYKALVQFKNTTYSTMTGTVSAEIQTTTDIYDITDLNSNTFKKKLAGLNDYTLKLSGNFDLSDTDQAALQAAVITSPGATLTWQILPTGTSGSAYYGTALLKTIDIKIDLKSQIQVSWDIEGNGAINYGSIQS